MARRFEDSYASASFFDDLNAEVWDRILKDLDLRLDAAEGYAPELEKGIAGASEVALARLNLILTPVLAKLQQAAALGYLMAPSSTPNTLTVGEVLVFTVPPGPQRELFTPSAFCTLTRAANFTDYAIVRTLGAYDPTDGTYRCQVLAAYGNPGPWSDWTIQSGAGVTLATQGLLAAVQAAAAAAAADRSLAQTAASQAASDKLLSGLNKAGAEVAAAAAQASADQAKTWDPTAYYPKTAVDQKLTDAATATDGKLAALKGSADAAHDTLGELAALVDANTAAVAVSADALARAERARRSHNSQTFV